jgi:hypothetical protein
VYWYFCLDELLYNESGLLTDYQHVGFAVVFSVNVPFFIAIACIAIILDISTMALGVFLMLSLTSVAGYDFFDSHTHNAKMHMLRKYTAWFTGWKRNVSDHFDYAFYSGDNAVFFRTMHMIRAYYCCYTFPKICYDFLFGGYIHQLIMWFFEFFHWIYWTLHIDGGLMMVYRMYFGVKFELYWNRAMLFTQWVGNPYTHRRIFRYWLPLFSPFVIYHNLDAAWHLWCYIWLNEELFLWLTDWHVGELMGTERQFPRAHVQVHDSLAIPLLMFCLSCMPLWYQDLSSLLYYFVIEDTWERICMFYNHHGMSNAGVVKMPIYAYIDGQMFIGQPQHINLYAKQVHIYAQHYDHTYEAYAKPWS